MAALDDRTSGVMRLSPCFHETSNRYVALAFRVLSSDFKFAGIIVAGGAVDALISLTRSADKPCRLRYGVQYGMI